jgi:hypothetical protein
MMRYRWLMYVLANLAVALMAYGAAICWSWRWWFGVGIDAILMLCFACLGFAIARQRE